MNKTNPLVHQNEVKVNLLSTEMSEHLITSATISLVNKNRSKVYDSIEFTGC